MGIGSGSGGSGGCTSHEDCDGSTACCQGRCETKQLDWAGVGYCAFECKGCPTCSQGTCPRKQLGESCWYDQDCAVGDCCQGRCEMKKLDWAGVEYCPSECKGCPTCSLGTCPKKRLGESCVHDQDCLIGDCCGGECALLKRDWANVCYCPNVCVGNIGGGSGSCQNRPDCN